jgi:hypothetical protein
VRTLECLGDTTRVTAPAVGGVTIVTALLRGMAEHREWVAANPTPPADLKE